LTQIKNDLIHNLWHGIDVFADHTVTRDDDQGWNSDHQYLTEAIESIRPEIVVEVGVWKGRSVMNMARKMQELSINGVIIAVDTWLGSSEHWLDGGMFNDLMIQNGCPTLYQTFLSNIKSNGLDEYVLPLPMTSICASEILKSKSISPSVIHLDAGHDFASVTSDLTAWWPLLAKDGVFIGDDYCHAWPGVTKAFDAYFGKELENYYSKCRIYK
jgi:hypothetical protein